MQALITDLLVYSRAGRGDLNFQECDTDALFRTTIDVLGPAIRESGAKVYVEALPTVAADPVKLGQVFQNLVANAIKFAGDDPPHVTASAARSDVAWSFSVRDHGIGIEARHRERVFKIFNRLHGRDEYPGTGIGLALCKRLVEAHGGTIRVGEVEAEGTLVQFTIPDREASP
jgi:light-regulated signal transduction histidine kinase (bacteriophytochrome)